MYMYMYSPYIDHFVIVIVIVLFIIIVCYYYFVINCYLCNCYLCLVTRTIHKIRRIRSGSRLESSSDHPSKEREHVIKRQVIYKINN